MFHVKQFIIYKGDVDMLQSFNRLFAGGDQKDGNEKNEEVTELRLDQIVPKEYQPRVKYDDEKIAELAQTVKTHGTIQPIVVRNKSDDVYELIAGERRNRAPNQINCRTIPALRRDMSDKES